MAISVSQKQKAIRFHELHHNGKTLMLVNIWDTLGALLIESLGYTAIATASASVAFANGYNDGENIPLNELLVILKKICESVNIPVTADIESGFCSTSYELQENIKLFIETGIAGINIEDTDKKTNELVPIDFQCNQIRVIRKIADEMDVPLFINARTDVYLNDKRITSPAARLEEAVKRGIAYKEAGADGFFPVTIKSEEDIKELIEKVNLPLNIVTVAGIPGLKTLSELGVARISLGPSFLKIAIKAMKELAMQLKDLEGLTSITGNEITSGYLKDLVIKNNQAG